MNTRNKYKIDLVVVTLLTVSELLLCYMIRHGIQAWKGTSSSTYFDFALHKAAYCIVVVCFVLVFGKKDIFRIKKQEIKGRTIVTKFYFSMLILLLMVYLISAWMQKSIHMNTFNEICSYICYAMLIGFQEEVFFRGLCFRRLYDCSQTKRERQFAFVWTGLLFGAIHFYPLLYENDVPAFLVQMFLAMAWGIVFACIYMENKNIWITILAHGLYDFRAGMNQGVFGYSGSTRKLPLIELKLVIFFVLLVGSVLFSIRYIWKIEAKESNASNEIDRAVV